MSDRKVVIVDLDNVVYDFIYGLASFITSGRADSASPDIDAMMAKYKTWGIHEDWEMPWGELKRFWRLGVEQNQIYAKGPLIPGARRALWQLSDAEWDIHIVSNRLTDFGLHDTIAISTATWLRDNNIPYRQLSLVNNKHRIMADAIVDDRENNMRKASHGQTFLFPANHNTGFQVQPNEQYSYWQNIVKTLCG